MTYTITPVDPLVPEIAGTYRFTVHSTSALNDGLYVSVVPLYDANTSGVTFQGPALTVFTLAPSGLYTCNIDVTIINDNFVEGDETFAIVLLPSATADPLTDFIARSVFKVVDDDAYVVADDYGDTYNDAVDKVGKLSLGETIAGNLEVSGDVDVFEIVLDAGVAYSVAVNTLPSTSGGVHDPYLALYNSSGQLVSFDDDSGAGTNSLLTYAPVVAGHYFAAASGFNNVGAGTYQIVLSSSGQSTTDDYAATYLTGGSFASGPTTTGTIETANDKDWFKVFLTAGTTYTISLNGAVTGSGSLYDPYVSLYSFGGVLLASDDDGGTGNNSLLQFTATTTGTHFIEAGSFGSGTGTYLVGVTSGSGSGGGGSVAGDDYVATPGTIGSISAGQSLSGNVETAADKDWIRIVMDAGVTYSIALKGAATGSGTLYDPFVTLYSSAGTLVASDDDSGVGNNSLLQYTATGTAGTSATYYIEARSMNGAGTGTYQLDVTSGAIASDDYAGSAGTTGLVAPGQSASGNIETAGDRDWFAIAMTAGTTYAIALNGQVTGSGTIYDPFVSLYTSAGVLVASNDDDGLGNNSLLQYTATSDATYYIEARSVSVVGTGTYQVGVTYGGGGAGGGGAGPSDDYAGTSSTSGSAAQPVTGSIETAGDKDWFAVTLAAGTSYSIALNGQATGSGTLYDPFVSLFNSAGVLLATNDDDGMGNNSLLQYTATADGTYYVEARSVSAISTGTYQVAVTAGASSGSDDYLATSGTAGSIAASQTLAGNIETAGDKDWFAVSLIAGTSYSFGLNGSTTASGTLYDPFVSLYNSAGVLLASNDDGGIGNNSLLQYVAASSGTYYVEARSFSASGTGTYEVAMSSGIGSGGTDDFADGLTDTPMGAIAPDSSLVGNLESAGDKDWFAVTLAAGNSYFISLNGQTTASGTLYDPFVSLYSSAGVLLASNDDGGIGNNSLLQYAAVAGGTYYVEARGFSAIATGTYELDVDLIGATVP